jgi:hypothetical protein
MKIVAAMPTMTNRPTLNGVKKSLEFMGLYLALESGGRLPQRASVHQLVLYMKTVRT